VVITIENNNILKVNYPTTTYYLLNQKIVNELNTIIYSFIDYQKELIKQDIFYKLNISYDNYTYQNKISYVFYITIESGSIRPNNSLFTINYDRYSNKIITIDDLINDNYNFLEKCCFYIRNKIITEDNTSDDLILEGTAPDKNNYNCFSFCDEGIIFYFQEYQIASNQNGIISILVPYNIIEDK
jgi:hypothetical protein